jgi:hypothetical protein
MIRFLLLLLTFGFLNVASAQTMQASIGVGVTPNSVKLYIKPISGTATGLISTMNFDVAIPDVTPGPTPALSITNNPFPAAAFQINVPYTESGYIHYNIANLNAFTITGVNAETEMLEVAFGGNTNIATVSLVTLPDQGVNGSALFLCSGGGTISNGSNLYYTRAGTTVTNLFSYTPEPNFGNPPGTSISTAVLSTGIMLPVNWLSFDAVKQGNDGLLNWTVTGEDAAQYYELQRSTNNSSFSSVTTINKPANSRGVYKYTDAGITNLGAAILYYRIKQVDINGKISYSDTRLLRLDIKGGATNIYPNPVKAGFYVSIPFANPDSRKVKLSLSNAVGQLISTKEITMLQATNYYFDISNKTLAAGNYNLQIILEDKVMETKQLYINQ